MSKIVVSNLMKKYNKKIVLNNINFTCENEILFIAGRNGAGKTTFLRIANNLEKANNGTIKYYNDDDIEDSHLRISTVFDTTDLFTELSGYSNIKILCPKCLKDKVFLNRVLNELSIDKDLLNKKVSKYSFGQKHRLCIAIAIIRKPKILFLDEPTIGLDPLSWDLVRKTLIMNKEHQNGCIILTGQDYDAMSSFADKILVLSNGKIKYHGKIKDFISLYDKQFIISTNVKNLPSEFNKYNVETKKAENYYIHNFSSDLSNVEIFKLLSRDNIEILDFKEEKINLQKAFLKSIQ